MSLLCFLLWVIQISRILEINCQDFLFLTEQLPSLSVSNGQASFDGGAQGLILCTYINSNIAQLRPAHSMIQVVFAKVVFRQIRNVGELDMRNVFWP
jgi:hypothetical protein